MRNCIFILFVSTILISCVTTPAGVRKPNSSGAEGSEGQSGSQGRDGHAGTFVVARGCESFITQSIGLLHDSYSAKQWASDEGDLEFMCGRAATISSLTTEKMHDIFDEKIGNLLGSGYFKSSAFSTGAFPRTMDGLKAKVGASAKLFEELENNPKRDFSCAIGAAKSDGRDQGKMKICFSSEIRSINPNGKVETTVTMLAYRQQGDGSFENYRVSEERVSTYTLPEKCLAGGAGYLAKDHGTSAGKPFEHKVVASCDGFQSTYSAIYPSFFVSYQR